VIKVDGKAVAQDSNLAGNSRKLRQRQNRCNRDWPSKPPTYNKLLF